MLVRYDPFREAHAMRRAMSRVMQSMVEPTEDVDEPQMTWSLALDVVEQDEAFLIKATVPGVNPDDIEITYQDNLLTIRGEIVDDKDLEQGKLHLRERRCGAFSRTIKLPGLITVDKIEARYDAGVLTLRLPKAEEMKPRKIAVQVSKK
ncbi:MAG TPA: Hsp20/alpha crystallin family protein [Anaerolineaceae bacterium]|nr:Hsp20/alpha crystallin family protein [Anaerolineaceae bacterium]